MSRSPDDSSDERDPVERLAEEFVARHRRGERPSPLEYAERHPQWAQRIHALFPALLLMEQHRPGISDLSEFPEDAGPATAPLEQLGDYRIIREVGRGGMAVVYEAEQESLGRHVALKVLLGHSRLQPRQTARFQREARAAARLHHTNIVPVYGVGEHDGIQYYVMQFIPGQALDEVLREVRRLRRCGAAAEPAQNCRAGARNGDSLAASATDVARELVSGRFAPIEFEGGDSPPLLSPGIHRIGREAEPEPPALRADRPPSQEPMPFADDHPRSVHTPVSADSSTLSGPSRQYWRGVARIGEQVAEALEYAHGQGVLHRDIKPSNLLLDLHGAVWVADFGLAKAADQADLTHPGDVVGTWRYMAPERFHGVSDSRSDVYSLGLTVYELLTLRPAFDGSTREELIRQVSHGVPTRPRKANPEVPRDLETIVLKAIDRDPAARYQSAGALAEDLRRFLDDRPIRARRCSPPERAWRWARRNPIIAALSASVILLLVALAIGSTLAAFWLNTERNRALGSLWNAYMAQAHAGSSSRVAGQRFTSLAVLNRAAKIRTTGDLRNEAIACLALVDLRPVRELAKIPDEDDGVSVDPELKRYALGDSEGNVSVYRVADGKEILRLPRGIGPNRHLEFSPGGHYLVAAYAVRRRMLSDLWDISRVESPRKVVDRAEVSFFFSADERSFATRMSDTTVGFYDPATGKLSKRLTLAPLSEVAGFHPDGRRLMIHDKNPRTLRLIEIERGKELWSHSFDVDMGAVAWRGDGRLFAASGFDHRIYVWDTDADRLQSVLEGHENSVVGLQFTHDGGLLLSSSWDGTLRVWDPVRGTNQLTAKGGLYRISADDRRLAFRGHSGLGIWELADGRECRALHHGMVGNRTPRPDHWGPHGIDFVLDGRLLASSSVDGIQFWDVSTGTPVTHLPPEVGAAANFSPDGSHLLTRYLSDEEPRIWTVKTAGNGSDRALSIGSPRYLGARKGVYRGHYSWDSTGRYVIVDDAGGAQAVVLDIANSVEIARLGPHQGMNQCPMSPDGRWVATATWKGKDVKVWEVATGRLAWQLPSDSAFVRFSPDGRWLAVARFPGTECRLYQVGSWRPGPTIHVGAEFLTMAFMRDGRLLAIDDAGRLRIVHADSGREVATLDAGTGSSARFFCMAFSPDGTYVAAGRDHMIHLWDLRRIREQLVPLGLDWELPPYPPARQHQGVGSVELISATSEADNSRSTNPETAAVKPREAATKAQ
jgi:serine/threonine protein kinase/WD40 repeat protein